MQNALVAFAEFMWGPWMVALLVGGGAFFLLYSRLLPFRALGHSLAILSGRYDSEGGEGELTHFQALTSALSGTIGMGNLAGTAVALRVGGPGALFWMWVSAFAGMGTQFFTGTLAVRYRGRDDLGRVRGGTMYVIQSALSERWQVLAMVFAVAGCIGCLPILATNQLVQLSHHALMRTSTLLQRAEFSFGLKLGVAILIAFTVAVVSFGGLGRLGKVSERLVSWMVALYITLVAWVMVVHVRDLPACFALVMRDAFTGQAAAGGVLAKVIGTGIRRAALSNEAGVGTEMMAHGAARTREPVREGLVAMLSPFVDTCVVCTATAMVLLLSGAWDDPVSNGITLTALAFERSLGGLGYWLLVLCAASFALSTLFSYSYYGATCFAFLFGAARETWYRYFFIALVIVSALSSLDTALSLIDAAYALMAIPTMSITLRLAPSVLRDARDYFRRLRPLATAPPS